MQKLGARFGTWFGCALCTHVTHIPNYFKINLFVSTFINNFNANGCDLLTLS